MMTGFIGGGQMAEAILAGALAAGALKAGEVLVTDVSAERLAALKAQYGVETVENDATGAGARAVAARCAMVVLAVKPQYAPAVLETLDGAFGGDSLLVSIVGGITLATLEGTLPGLPIVWVMPNTPMLVGRGSAGMAVGTHVGEAQLERCRQLFGAVGSTQVLPERLINPFTSVSGCGPAFASLFIEALADGGVEQGLPRDLALRLAAEMMAGTAEMMLKTGRHPGQLKDAVCSPGGGTIAGVHALERGAFRAAVMDAVAAACRRMEALG